ncbi:MAG: hypothetical protein KDJ77_17515 [Rhodobiaceae bacterium]|nr:hypothetical protein [Rhodobiaceae bacterium]
MPLDLRPRPEVLADQPALAWHIRDWQSQAFDLDEHRYAAGEDVWLDIDADAPVTLTAAQAEELNRQTEAEFAELLDPDPGLPPFERARFLVGELDAASMEAFTSAIGDAVLRLCAAMGWERLSVLPMVRASIIVQDNDFADADAATRTLADTGLTKDFSGAISGPAKDVAPLFGPLFWIARCNACAPYICFGAPGSATVGTLCQYANIHFDVYDTAEADALADALVASGFDVPDDGICGERFSETGAIEGRRLDLG